MKRVFASSIMIISILVCIIVYLYIRYSNKNTPLQNLETLGEEQIYKILQNKDFIYLNALASDGNLFYPVVENAQERKVLYNLIETTPKLIFYYSELNCNSCVEIIVKEVENYRDSIGSENIIYLANYRRARDMLIFKRINQIKSSIFNVVETSMPAGKVHMPFLFIIDKEKRVRSLFVPSKENTKNIKLYLSIIKKKYFGNKNTNENAISDLRYPNKNNSLVNKASVQVNGPTINFGKISIKAIKQASFLLKNRTKHSLIIQSVNTSCGCTVAKYEKKPVQEGETTTVVLEYKPNSLGFFTKTADVVCNVPEGYVRLKISGEVVEK